MKVLILTMTLGERSGWGRHAQAIIDNLILSGVEVEVCSQDTVEGLSYPVYQLAPLHTYALWALIKNTLMVRRRARGVDVVHALEGWPLGVYAWGATIGRPAPFFMNGVGTYSVAPLYAAHKRWLMRLVYRKVKKVFCISNYTMQELLKAGAPKDKLTVVHFGTPVLPVPSPEETVALCRYYNVTPERYPILLTVGAIKDRKGQLYTLKATEILKKKYPHILFIAAGSADDTTYVPALKAYAHAHDLTGNLLMLPDVDDKGIACLYAQSTMSVLASTNQEETHHFEGFGAVITEAYQFGKPAVGSRDCGIEDAIADGVTGLLARQEDPEDIADKISRVIDNIDVFSRNAKMRYADFSWDKTVKTYIDFYTRYVARKKHS